MEQAMEDWRRELEMRWGGRLLLGEPMSRHTSFRIGGPADALIEARSLDELCGLVRWAAERDLPYRVIGGGSNLLVADEGIDGLVVVNRCDAHRVIEAGGRAVIYVEAGRSISALSKEMERVGLAGLEWAAGLPGTVGGAVVGNAGAFGRSTADNLVRVLMLEEGHEQAWINPADLGFGYRSSNLKKDGRGRRIVLAAELELQRGERTQIEEASHAAIRARKGQPTEPSAGSVFKNPSTDRVARLIETAGLKGVRIGDAQVSPRHANFIVNCGRATAGNVLELIEHIRTRVRDQFQLELELEIECVGRHTHFEGRERKAG